MPYRSTSSGFVDRVRSAAGEAMEAVGGEADDAMRESLATPYPPASSPGNPPHRRTGNLQDGVEHAVDVADDGVTFKQGVSREGGDPLVPLYLEFGTRKMAARPFVSPIKEEYGPKMHGAIADALRTLSSPDA